MSLPTGLQRNSRDQVAEMATQSSSSMRRFWFSVAHTSGARGYALVANMVILVITARWLGPEGRGILGATTTWVALFSTIGCLSLGQVTLYYAVQRRGEAWLAPVLGSLLFLTGVVTLLGWCVALILHWTTQGSVFNQISPGLLCIGFLMLPFMVWEQYGSSLLMAIDRLKVYNNAQLVAKTTSVAVLIAALALKLGIASVLVIALVSQIIVSVAGLRELFSRAGGVVRPRRETVRSLLLGGLKLHLNTVGTFFILSSNILIINWYCGPTETGYYQLALQLIGVLVMIPTAMSMVLYGRVAQLGPDVAWAEQREVLLLLSGGMMGAAVLAAIAGPWLIPLVGGPSFTPAIRPFQWLLLTTVGMTFSAIMGPQWIGRGLFWQASAITMTLGTLNVLASLVSVPRYGLYGAVWGMVATYALVVLINGLMAAWCEVRCRQHQSGLATFSTSSLGNARAA